ncbi:TPA: 23S rRNA (guanosine(2251)-2'-O)-methyltransferase RlmB [Candidatus Ventrenecus avicola]|nr:23S rRNA (guanosine(2251)-2'-O)-methyltransferase RlmB [Candidatus Ventrenecus avicola]
MLAYGKNVLYMTNPTSIKKVYISKSKQDKELFDYLKKNKIHYIVVDKELLNKMTKEHHQGIVLEIEDFQYSELEEIMKDNFLLMLDHLEDPHNLGAIIRSAEAAGITGIILPKDRSVTVTDTVIKTSAGAINNLKIVKVTNLVDTIKKLQKENFFIYGADMEGTDIREAKFAPKKVLVIGNEGKGISKVVEKNCDEMIRIPMKGEINSLNASVAAAILIFKMGGLS